MKTSTKRVGAILAGVIALAVVVGLALGNGGVRSYPEGSPEAAAQDFLQSMFDDDLDAAREMLAPALAARCDRADLRFSPLSYQDVAQITDASIDGDTASVTVVLSDDTGLFDAPYEDEHTFDMALIDGAWRITDLDERFGCR